MLYEIRIELHTGYSLNVLEAAASIAEARSNLVRKLKEMGWRETATFTIEAVEAVEVTPVSIAA